MNFVVPIQVNGYSIDAVVDSASQQFVPIESVQIVKLRGVARKMIST